MASEITLADVRKELWSGVNELYQQFIGSIVQQQALTPEQESTLAAYMQITEKRDKLADFIKSLEAEAKAIREKEISLASRRREFENLAYMFKSSIQAQLENWQGQIVRRVDGNESSFRLHANPESVEIYDIEKIPKKYRRYTWTPDKEAIKCAIAEGKKVRGARIAEKTSHLKIV